MARTRPHATALKLPRILNRLRRYGTAYLRARQQAYENQVGSAQSRGFRAAPTALALPWFHAPKGHLSLGRSRACVEAWCWNDRLPDPTRASHNGFAIVLPALNGTDRERIGRPATGYVCEVARPDDLAKGL